MQATGSAIGVFDSGYGGLTVLKELVSVLPQYDYLYLGDNARAPYGTRSFETVHAYTLQAVQWFFKQGCNLVILACNTASAKALRTIQQQYLPQHAPGKKVLGVIRPTAEVVGGFSKTGHIGVLATPGTVQSLSYVLEVAKFYPGVVVHQQSCPLWVPLIENNEHRREGADFFVQKDLDSLLAQQSGIDTILLGCTHYPLLEEKIKQLVPAGISVISQGNIVAQSLQRYLEHHPEIETTLSTTQSCRFYTTDEPDVFDEKAAVFYGKAVQSRHAVL